MRKIGFHAVILGRGCQASSRGASIIYMKGENMSVSWYETCADCLLSSCMNVSFDNAGSCSALAVAYKAATKLKRARMQQLPKERYKRYKLFQSMHVTFLLSSVWNSCGCHHTGKGGVTFPYDGSLE